ncbi:interferon lambda-3-like [Talpa occidentalis]|uniref:interferon lambda-3-like n=1 Tax=Talpa occidentalis TaxID=50954 RepID=UPI00188E9DA3|nr:interferon lambda-3-like [Talpa occidentalis]
MRLRNSEVIVNGPGAPLMPSRTVPGPELKAAAWSPGGHPRAAESSAQTRAEPPPRQSRGRSPRQEAPAEPDTDAPGPRRRPRGAPAPNRCAPEPGRAPSALTLTPSCLSSRRTDAAVASLLLLLLPPPGPELPGTAAGPVPKASGAEPGARGCHMAQFRSLSPGELQAFRRAKDALEERLLLRDCSCGSRPFPRTRDLRQLQVWERPVALEAEVALTLEVLGGLASSSPGAALDQPLGTLRHVHAELRACLSAQPAAGARPRGRLHHWLQRLREARRKESAGCLEASVTFNLFRLLSRDLPCVASGDLCV